MKAFSLLSMRAFRLWRGKFQLFVGQTLASSLHMAWQRAFAGFVIIQNRKMYHSTNFHLKQLSLFPAFSKVVGFLVRESKILHTKFSRWNKDVWSGSRVLPKGAAEYKVHPSLEVTKETYRRFSVLQYMTFSMYRLWD